MSELIKILYVDDEEINLELFKLNYEDIFDVVTAFSGKEGLDILQDDDKIALIISDMKMPNMDGLEFIEKVRETNPQIPCFILTGFDENDQIRAALKTNVIQKYISKPFDLILLEEVIWKYVK